MSDELLDSLANLITKSLEQWRCEGVLETSPDAQHVLTLTSGQHAITIERAAQDLPFRWNRKH